MALQASEFVLAAGAVGTAAFGIVEGLKVFAVIGEAGFAELMRGLGGLRSALLMAYGDGAEGVLRGLYRGDADTLARVLRQGVRVGLTRGTAPAVAATLGGVDPAALAEAADVALSAPNPTAAQRTILGRYELAADARIDAALAAARARYVASARLWAMLAALLLAVAGKLVLPAGADGGTYDWATTLIVGIAAVPLAPIAKDVASGIQAAVRALKARG